MEYEIDFWLRQEEDPDLAMEAKAERMEEERQEQLLNNNHSHMNLETAVQDQLNALVGSGKIEEIIQSNVENTVKSIIKDSLSEYSDFGKNLKNVIKEVMKVDVSKVSALMYQQIVIDQVNKSLEENLLTQIQQPLSAVLGKILAPFEQRTYKLSEMVEVFKDQERDGDEDGYLTVLVEDGGYSAIYVGLDKEEDKQRYSCEYQFSIDKKTGVIWSFEAKGYRSVSMDVTKNSFHGAFEKMLFNLYASQCPIELDENHVNSSWDNEDY